MPKDVTEMTTVEIIADLVNGGFSEAFEIALAQELQARIVPNTDPEVAWRGGVRPNRTL